MAAVKREGFPVSTYMTEDERIQFACELEWMADVADGDDVWGS